MPYCVPDDVRGLNQLITVEDFPDVDILVFIAKATARIDNRIQPFYEVPLPDPVPDIVNSITADMAAALLLQNHFSGINYREDTPLAEVFRKRAEEDLVWMLDHATIDGLPGVIKKQPDVPETRMKVASSTPHSSPLKQRLKRFERATQSPISNVRDNVNGREWL